MGAEGVRGDRFALDFSHYSGGDLVLCSSLHVCFLVLVMLVSGKENSLFESGPGQHAVLEMGQLGSRGGFVQLMVTVSSNALRAMLDHAAGPAVLMNSRSRNQGEVGHMRIVSDTAG